MTQIILGHSHKQVTAIGLGAMPLSLAGRPDEKTAISVISAFIDNGGNFIDTANVYCMDDDNIGHNECLINRALSKLGKKSEIIVATKGGLRRPKGSWEVDGHPEWIRESCEKSLQDLQVDCIFLYQLHAPDPKIPFSESIGEMVRLREKGKIQFIGLSNVTVKEIEIALKITPILSVQNRCNVFDKKAFKNGVVEKCRSENIVFIPHSPVGGHNGHAKAAQSDLLKKIASNYNTSTYQIMLAWLLYKGKHILPIPGASKTSSVLNSLEVLNLKIDGKELVQLDDV